MTPILPSSPPPPSSLHSFEADPEKHSSDLASDEGDAQSMTSTLAERRFLRRLDVCLLSWAWCAYIIKQMDASNYKVNYASGMKEDVSASCLVRSLSGRRLSG
jgi:hypothetical protein